METQFFLHNGLNPFDQQIGSVMFIEDTSDIVFLNIFFYSIGCLDIKQSNEALNVRQTNSLIKHGPYRVQIVIFIIDQD